MAVLTARLFLNRLRRVNAHHSLVGEFGRGEIGRIWSGSLSLRLFKATRPQFGAWPSTGFAAAINRCRTSFDGLNTRLGRARQLYGPGRSLPFVANGLYEKLDELRQLYGSESIEEMLDGIIDRKRRLNRLAELQSKMVLSAQELREFQVLKQQFKQYVADLARQKAQSRAIDAKFLTAKIVVRI